jgi:hypothetical protein
MAAPIYIPTNREQGFLSPCILSICCCFFSGMKDNLNVVLICISLMAKNDEHFFHVFISYFFSFLKFLFYSYVHTMFGSFFPPSPHPLSLPLPSLLPPLPPLPLATWQKLFCPYL